MWRKEWEIFGGICVALIVWGFARHIYYVVKNVWLVKLALNKPLRVMPLPGVVTLSGIVSSIGENCPVQVTIVEHGKYHRGQIYWRQTSLKVEAHPFALLLPELGARVLVEPGEVVNLRASATVTDWEKDKEADEDRRVRTAMLVDGDRVIVTGVLSESRQVELIANQYRSQKEKVRVEYVLKSNPNKAMAIDSETLLHEIRERFGYLGWLRGISTVLLLPVYVYAQDDGFFDNSLLLFASMLFVYVFARLGFTEKDRLPWFDRHTSFKKPYRNIESPKRTPG